jgi:hypothetical protein
MIDFNINDFNVQKIKKESKLYNFMTKYHYRVYGLTTENNNPLVLIDYDPEIEYEENFTSKIEKLASFFKKNGIKIEHDTDSEHMKIHIGLRRDLRDHVLLSAAILQTIIFSIENKLNLKDGYSVPGIPKFS